MCLEEDHSKKIAVYEPYERLVEITLLTALISDF